MTALQALSADAFVGSAGVNVHPHYGVTDPSDAYAGNWVPLVSALGIRHVRANIATSGGSLAVDKAAISALGAAGIGYMFQVAGSAALTAYLAAGLPAPEAVEPWNEWDANGGASWASDITAFQPSLYSGIKAQWPSALVLGASLANNANQASVGSLAPNADAANVHVYQSPAGDPEGGTAFSSAQVSSYLTQAPGKPLWLSETGWSAGQPTDTGVWTTELAQARLIPRALLHCFAPAGAQSISSTPFPTGRGGLGAARTYLYELLDEHDPAASDQDRFGLFRHDLSPKPAATAVSSLLHLLADPGPSFALPSLDVTAHVSSGAVPDYLLFAKRDGSFWLAFWWPGQVSAFPGGGAPAGTVPLSGADSADTAHPVTFTFGQSFGRITRYRPMNGAGPAEDLGPDSQVTVDARLDVQLLRLDRPWPQSPLDVRTELMGTSGWQTAAVRRSTEIAVQRPRSGEQDTFAPAVTAVELPSNNGEWLPGGSNAPSWWGLGVPLRISVPGDGTYLRLEDFTSWAQAPDSVPLHITGDTDIRLDCKPTDYRFAALCSKSDPSGTHAWLLDRLSDGTLQFFWWDSGANLKSVQSTLPVPLGRIAIRVTLSVATGTVTFYTAPNISGTWTQLGTAASGTGGAATSVNAATAPVRVGDQAVSSTGAYFGFQLRNGIGGTVAASPDFTAQAAGTTSFTDAQGNVWALNGTAELSDRDYRYHGQVTQIEPEWADASARVASVRAEAGGILERLSAGDQPAWSAMRRYVQSLTGDLRPVVCWPMEDGPAASQFAEILSSDPGANAIPITAGTPASDSTSFICASPLAVLGNVPSEISIPVPDFTPGSTTVIRMLANVTSADATTGGQLLSIAMDDNASLLVTNVNAAGNIRLALSGGIDTGFVSFGGSVIGRPLMYSWELTLSGGAVQVRFLTWDISGGNVIGPSAVGYSGTLKIPRLKISGPLIAMTAGFLKVQKEFTDVSNETAAFDAYRGELAASRAARLLSWSGIPCRIIGYPAGSEAMSGEPPATLQQLLQQVEDADGGAVFEPRQAAAVGYRTRASMTGQAAQVTASYTAGHIGGTGSKLSPKLNNTPVVNDVTVTAKGLVSGAGAITGSSARAVLDDGSRMSVSPPEKGGSGRWAKNYDTWVHDAGKLPAIAARRLARGTVAGMRWPQVPFALANPQLGVSRTAEMLADGTFEKYASSPALQAEWTAAGGTATTDGAQHHTGSRSAFVAVAGSPSQVILRPAAGFLVPVVPGAAYTASVWVRTGAGGTSFAAVIDWWEADGVTQVTGNGGTVVTPAPNTWTQLTVTATAPAGAALAGYGPTLKPVSGTGFSVDDVTFTLAAGEPATLREALRRLDIGDRLNVLGMPAGAADLDQLAWGMTEVLGSKGGRGWDINVNTIPASPWEG